MRNDLMFVKVLFSTKKNEPGEKIHSLQTVKVNFSMTNVFNMMHLFHWFLLLSTFRMKMSIFFISILPGAIKV